MNIKKEVRSSLIKMLIPAMSGMIMTFLFQLVDTYFIGQLGSTELTAVSFTYPIYFAMISIFMGLAVGVGATVGKAFGENDQLKVKELTLTSLILSIIIGISLSAFIYQTRYSLYATLGASTHLFEFIDSYLIVIFAGMPALMIALIGMSSLRATGKALVPDLVMGIGGLINLVLDYILIFGTPTIPAMGIRGAAIATVISWLFVMFIIMIFLIFKGPLKTKGHTLHFVKRSLSILHIGLPAIGVQLVVPLAIGFMTRYVSAFGPESVAAFGIATKIESLSLTLILAMSIVLVPMTAQRYGAKEKQHLDEIVALSGKTAIYWSLFLYMVILLLSEQIASIFTDNEAIIRSVKSYLIILGFSYPMFGITHITNSFFNAVGQPMQALKITVIKYTVILIPLLHLASYFDLNLIWLAISLSNILGGLIASKLFKKWLTQENSIHANANLLKEYTNDFRHLKNKLFSKSIK